MPYKWIQQKIESLDPEKDYEQIWKLSASYGLNNFMLNLGYVISTLPLVVSEHGAQALWREDGGKVLHKATQRARNSASFGVIASWYGPTHPRTLEEVETVNRLHDYWAAKLPGHFSHTVDFIYPICFNALQQHLLLVKLGLPGFSSNQKIAAHLFWRDIYKLIRMPGGKQLNEFPKDWDGMTAALEDLETRYCSGTEKGRLIAEAVLAQFSYKFFPPGLHWLGRCLVLSLCSAKALTALGIRPVHPAVGWLLRLILCLFYLFASVLLPDPRKAYWEVYEEASALEKVNASKRERELDRHFPATFSQHIKQQGLGCPF